jgi:hypothetical protein
MLTANPMAERRCSELMHNKYKELGPNSCSGLSGFDSVMLRCYAKVGTKTCLGYVLTTSKVTAGKCTTKIYVKNDNIGFKTGLPNVTCSVTAAPIRV